MDCSLIIADPTALSLCVRSNEAEDKLDSVQTLVYIVAGVGGGMALVILILVIALIVQSTSLRNRVTALAGRTEVNVRTMPQTKESSRFGGDQQTHNGQQLQQPPPQSRTQQPQGPGVTSEEELANLGFAAYTGASVDPSRGIGPSPLSPGNNGGVRVLPRNPPTGFRNNASYNNDGFM